MTAFSVLASALIAELVRTAASHMVAATASFHEELAVGALFELRALDEPTEHVVHHVRVVRVAVLLAGELPVILRHALQTVLLPTHRTVKLPFPRIFKRILTIRSHALSIILPIPLQKLIQRYRREAVSVDFTAAGLDV